MVRKSNSDLGRMHKGGPRLLFARGNRKLASCPRCGQPYAEPLDFCLYCEYDLRKSKPQAPSARSQPAAVAPQVPEKRKTIRNLIVIVFIVIVALYALAVVVGH